MKTFRTFISITLAVLVYSVKAQESMIAEPVDKILLEEIKQDTVQNELYKPFDFNLQVKNMHLWRGFRVTDAPMTAADVSFKSKNGKIKAGIWGGAGFNGDYTEFDYYISYSSGGFYLAVWDINNFSDFPNANIFNYDKDTTSHFVDITASYTFKKIPISFSWSTIFIGRDTYVDNETGTTKNAFTNFLQLNAKVYERVDSSLILYISGAFSPVSRDIHFYGQDFLNSFGIIYNKDVNLFNEKVLPVSATALWNADLNYGALQVAVSLF
ncbi:MAG: hypothetical protein CMB97_00215 [Flavobacteriaceae bacterium]|nr:hypothetical protein [Flavobacteriaceae bacterium]